MRRGLVGMFPSLIGTIAMATIDPLAEHEKAQRIRAETEREERAPEPAMILNRAERRRQARLARKSA